jgi:hypothetical protein
MKYQYDSKLKVPVKLTDISKECGVELFHAQCIRRGLK